MYISRVAIVAILSAITGTHALWEQCELSADAIM